MKCAGTHGINPNLQMQRHGFHLFILGSLGELILFLDVLPFIALNDDVGGVADGIDVLQIQLRPLVGEEMEHGHGFL